MTRQEYKNQVIKVMIDNPAYGKYHMQNFNTFGGLGESCPINSAIINDMPRGEVILSEQVYEMLMDVVDVSNTDVVEVPFFLFGTEISGNVIEFNEFMSSSRDRQSSAASFNDEMVNYLEQRLNGGFHNGLVACHGHTHPPVGTFYQNFSLGDLTTYMQMNEENEVFKNRKVELVGCLVTSTWDVNFVFYDNRKQDFYRFTNVFVKDMHGNLKPVNAYGLRQAETQAQGQPQH